MCYSLKLNLEWWLVVYQGDDKVPGSYSFQGDRAARGNQQPQASKSRARNKLKQFWFFFVPCLFADLIQFTAKTLFQQILDFDICMTSIVK